MQSAHLGQTRGSCPQPAFSGGLRAGASLFIGHSFCFPWHSSEQGKCPFSSNISSALLSTLPPSSLVDIPPHHSPSLHLCYFHIVSLSIAQRFIIYLYLSSFPAGMNMPKRQRPWDFGFVFVVVYDSEPRTVPGT